MTKIPVFTEKMITSRIDARSVSRGRAYARNGAIVTPQVVGNLLKGQCYGSRSTPYRVSAEFDQNTLTTANCTCPVGGGGYCKHVAALLFAWLDDSSQFLQTASLQAQLEARDKAQLIALIQQMVVQYPKLGELIALTPTDTSEINPELIRRQVQDALQEAEYSEDYYHAASEAADRILEVAAQIRALIAVDNWQESATLYTTIAAETLPVIDQLHDHDGDLYRVIYECSERLAECLEHIIDAAERETILQSLYEIVLADITVGGYGFADMAYDPLLEQSTAAEKQLIVEWVQEALASVGTDKYTSTWRKQALGGLRLRLSEGTMSDDEYIALCLEAERLIDAVARMLDLGRVGSAEAVARNASDYDLLQIADLFLANGHSERGAGLIWERKAQSSDRRLDEWLQKYAEKTGDWQTAVNYAKARFEAHPALHLYQELARVAEQNQSWQTVRVAALEQLEQDKNFTLLIDITLHEDQPQQALTYLDRLHSQPDRWGRIPFDQQRAIKVANAIETIQPQRAIDMYRTIAEKLIAVRGRHNYQEAAKLLQRVKAVALQNKWQAQWQTLITRLRTENSKLRAMKDEFNRAGL